MVILSHEFNFVLVYVLVYTLLVYALLFTFVITPEKTQTSLVQAVYCGGHVVFDCGRPGAAADDVQEVGYGLRNVRYLGRGADGGGERGEDY